jgi:N,N'-diacetyllegionaminate synthase
MGAILIAECCQNHNGSRETLKKMIHAAAESGADYAKIQALRSREITLRERFEEGIKDAQGKQVAIKRPYKPEVDRLSKLDLSLDDEAWFVLECQRAGVVPMTTVFTRTALREVRDMGFEAVKLASYDCRSYPLLREVRQYWSNIVVSTGATYDNEIEQAAKVLEGKNFAFLHCVTLYPTPMDQLHLRRMAFLRRFTPNVGFSDHTAPAATGLWATKIALAMGATHVERHFTILPAGETRDGPVSITPAQLKELRQFADLPRTAQMEHVRREYPEWEKSLGQMKRTLSDVELLNRDYYAGRFASKVDGRDIFNWEDVSIPS